MDRPRAVLFDMDGVLIDSYLAHRTSWRQLAAERGLTFTDADFDATFGRTSREVIAAVWGAQSFSPEQIAQMDDRKEDLFRQLIEADFPLMPGAPRLLRLLEAAGYRLAVASSGPPENVALCVAHLDRYVPFGAVVTGQDVARGKPHPEVFLTAAARLGGAAGDCVVVEDAPAGVEAAHAAGMACVALVSTGRRRDRLAAAERVVDHLDELSVEDFDRLTVARRGGDP